MVVSFTSRLAWSGEIFHLLFGGERDVIKLRRTRDRSPAWSIDHVIGDPVADLIGANRTLILRVLAAHEPLTANDAAARTTLSRRRAKKTLLELVALGLATREPDRDAYWVNDGYVLTGPLLEALDARPDAFTRIRALAEETVGPETTVAVYGPDNDASIGVLIVRRSADRESATELAEILTRVLPRMLGGTPKIEITGRTELAERIERRDPIALNNWWRSETVFGPNLADSMMTTYRRTVPRNDG